MGSPSSSNPFKPILPDAVIQSMPLTLSGGVLHHLKGYYEAFVSNYSTSLWCKYVCKWHILSKA